MKKFFSVMAALLLAVFTATGVHAAKPSQAGNTKVVNSSVAGATVTAVAQASIPVAKSETGVLFAFEVGGVPEGTKYTLTVSNPEVQNGQTYSYVHYKSDTDATVVDSGTVVANGDQLTLSLTGCSPVVIKAVPATKGADSAKKTTTASPANAATTAEAVPNTVDAE